MQRRNTAQRLAVFEAIDYLGHATSDELILYMNKTHSDVSLATIYRNLTILIEDGQVKKLKLGNFDIYETVKQKHYHFICNSCKKIFDIPIEDYKLLNIPYEIENNLILEHDLILYGYCYKCRNKQ